MRKELDEYFEVSNLDGEIEAYSTGCISLDLCIGVGGIPKRRFTEIFGEESTGKSTLALSIANTVINSGGKVLYVDTENQMAEPYIKDIVKNYSNKNFLLIRPYTAEDAFKILEKGIQDNYNLIVLDSVAALSPLQEIKKEFDEDSMTLTSRMLNKFFRRQVFNVRNNNIAVIFLNQVRDKIGTYFKSFETPGGHALKHYTSVRIFLSKGKKIKQNDVQIGFYINAAVVKNKVAPPYRSTSLPLIFGKGFDFILDLISVAELLGVVNRSGSFYKFEGQNIGQGILAVKEYLENNTEMLDKITEECYNLRNNLKGGSEFLEDE